MPRLSLTKVIPVLIFVGGFLLFVHKWTAHPPESGGGASVAAAGLPSGPQAGSGLASGGETASPPANAERPSEPSHPVPGR